MGLYCGLRSRVIFHFVSDFSAPADSCPKADRAAFAAGKAGGQAPLARDFATREAILAERGRPGGAELFLPRVVTP